MGLVWVMLQNILDRHDRPVHLVLDNHKPGNYAVLVLHNLFEFCGYIPSSFSCYFRSSYRIRETVYSTALCDPMSRLHLGEGASLRRTQEKIVSSFPFPGGLPAAGRCVVLSSVSASVPDALSFCISESNCVTPFVATDPFSNHPVFSCPAVIWVIVFDLLNAQSVDCHFHSLPYAIVFTK